MRFKRNVVTIAYASVFALLMLLGMMHVVAMSYEAFTVKGMGLIFTILMVIGVLLFFIGSFFLREKAALRGFQAEKTPLIILEILIALAVVGFGFYLNMDGGFENGLWVGAYLLLVYGVCRLVGGRVCGLFGVGVAFAITYFTYQNKWAVYSKDEIVAVLCLLAPFFAFLLVTKFVIPQFGKNSAVVVCALVVLSALFGAAIVLNPLTAVLCLGCCLSLVFANLRTVDTTITKGPVLAVILFLLSGGCAFGMSFLMEKDLISLFSITFEPGFDNALSQGSVLNYSLNKFHDMLGAVLYHTFDYGVFSAVLFLLAAMAGVYAIRRKLSEIGPMLLTMVVALVGYVMVAGSSSHSFYLTYLLAIFAAYGFYNMVLPEFLGKYAEEEEVEMFDDDETMPSVDDLKQTEVKGKVADENRESSSSDSSDVSEAAETIHEAGVASRPGAASSVNAVSSSEREGANFQEWHVSNEFVREDQIRKERQEERERSYRVAKEQEEARAAGESEEEIAAIATAAENEAKAAAAGRVVYTGEDGSTPSHDANEIPMNTGAGQDLVLDFSDVVQENTDGVATMPTSTPPASIQTGVDTGPDMSQIPNRDLSAEEQAQEISESHRSDTDTLVISGYQNESHSHHGIPGLDGAATYGPALDISDALVSGTASFAPDFGGEMSVADDTGADTAFDPTEPVDEGQAFVFSGVPETGSTESQVGAADLLNAINEAEVPTVEIPDVPAVGSSDEVSSVEAQTEEDTSDLLFVDASTPSEADDAEVKLQEAAASFVGGEVASAIQPGDDEQLDSLLDRLDMSDSIKRMNASAREDMADVIENADDQTEDEVVLVNEDYNFGNEDGEYGEIPTVSDLEDRWRAEQQLQQVPEEEVPDVVSAGDVTPEEPADVTSGFDFSMSEPSGSEDTMDTLSFDDIKSEPEEVIAPVTDTEPDMFSFDSAVPEPEPVAEPMPDITPVQPEAVPLESISPVPVAEPETVPFESVSPVPEPAVESAPIQESGDFVSLKDMAVQSSTAPEEILPSEPVVSEADSYVATSFEPDISEKEDVKITPFEPERIEKPEPTPVANHTDQSPVYSFTRKDVNIDVREDEGQLGIPKPGQEPMSHYVDRYAQAASRSGKPMAAELDNYEKKKPTKPIHTEEVVTRNTNGSTRSYHKILI